MGAMPSHDDDVSRRTGEMLGNRVPGLNRPKALPTEGLGMVSKSHLTVKPVAGGSPHHHSRGESQSLGSNHRRFASQSSYSAFSSPSLSAYDGEFGVGLSEVDEFGGLNGLGSPQIPSGFSPMPSPEVTAIDKLPGKVIIPDRFQRRVVSDSQASYGFTRALTPDPEMPLEPLEEETPLPVPNDCFPPEEGSVPEPQTHDDPKEAEVQLFSAPIPELQISTPETQFSPPPVDPSGEVPTETVLIPTTLIVQVSEPTSELIPVVDAVKEEGVEMDDHQRSTDIAPATQDQDRDPIPEVPMPNPIAIPSAPVVDGVGMSPALPEVSAPSIPIPAVDAQPIVEGEQPASEPVEELIPSVKVTQGSDDPPTPGETPTSPTLAFPLPPINASLVDDDSSQSHSPPESPNPPSSISTSASDLSDSTIDYRYRSDHPDPDHDLFVLPLPRDDELPPRPVVQEVVVPHSMYQVLASPLPTLQSPIDFPIMTSGSISPDSPDPSISFTGDESLALDASQAEIVIAQSEVIRPASPTLLIAMPSPSPTTTTFRVETPPLPEEPLPPPAEIDDPRVSPPRIRKKLYANHSIPTNFKDTLSPPPTQRSFSAVVHQKTRTSNYIIPPDRVDSLIPKSSKPASVFMTPKKKQSLFSESIPPASPGTELAFLANTAAILEAQLGDGSGSSGNQRPENQNPAKQSALSFTEPLQRSMLGSGMARVKSASTPALVPTSVTTPDHIPPVPDLVYDDGRSNFGFFSNPQIPSFLPQPRSRKSGAQDEADRKSLAPSHKSRKSAKEKDRDTVPRARKLSSRLRSLASSSTNSLRSFGRPSLSSETSVSFEGPTTVSIEPVTPQNTGGHENGRLGVGIESPGSRSQISQGSGSEWGSPPRRRDVLGRASSFADRLLTRAGKARSTPLENSQGNALDHRWPLIGS